MFKIHRHFSYLYCFDNKFKIIRYIFIKCMWVMNAKYMRTHTAVYSNQLCSHVHKWNISLYLLHLINKTVIYGHTYEHIKFKIEFNHNKIAAWKYSHDWCYFFQTHTRQIPLMFQNVRPISARCGLWLKRTHTSYMHIFSAWVQNRMYGSWYLKYQNEWDFHLFNGTPNANVRII